MLYFANPFDSNWLANEFHKFYNWIFILHDEVVEDITVFIIN
jgi:hypothetical protein